MQRSNVTHVDGLASISHLTIHSMQMQERWFWLAEGPCSPLSLVIRLGEFHSLLSSMGSTGTIVAGNVTDAFNIMHVHSSFERDNRLRTVLFT